MRFSSDPIAGDEGQKFGHRAQLFWRERDHVGNTIRHHAHNLLIHNLVNPNERRLTLKKSPSG